MSIKILVVEDDFANQQVAKLFLQKFGYEVEVASDGQVAIEKLAEAQFDLAFMDCQMPIMNGFDATKHIRENAGKNQDIPIVALTANLVAGTRESCLNAGMSDLMNKPINMQELQAMVEKWTQTTQ